MNLNRHLFPKGKQHLFRSGINLAIILDVNPYSKVFKAVTERRDLFDLKPKPIEHPHLTLHMINFNAKHPYVKKNDYEIIKKMKDFTKECYNEILRGYKLKTTDYVILGKPQDPTFAVSYELNFKNRITQFRLCLYNKLAELIGLKDHTSFKKGLVHELQNDKKAFVYSTDSGMPLYGIHEYYHGVNQWEPHISLFKLKEETVSNGQEIGELFFGTRDYRVIDRNNISMIQPFKGDPKYDLDHLILSELNFGKIKISTIGAKKEIHYTGATKSSKSKKSRKSKRSKSKKYKKTKRRKTRKR
mgnify:CR=1 FL=1